MAQIVHSQILRCGKRFLQQAHTALSGTAVLAGLSVGSLMLPPHQALAQAANAAPALSSKLEEITVTARKRKEKLLDAPLAITALSAKELRTENITSLTDVAEFVPGFTLDNDGSDHTDRAVQNLFIRGMSSSVSPSVSVFIDGAPVATGFVSDIWDAQSVEILKGPQSAFFGRETFGGAVNITTKDPTDELHGNLDALYASDNTYDLKAEASGAIVPGKVFLDVALRDYSTDGQYKSTIAPYDKLGKQTTQSVSVALVLKPIDDLKIKIFASDWKDDDGPAPVYKFGSADYNCNGGSGGADNYVCGTLPVLHTTNIPVQASIDNLFVTQVLDNASKTLQPFFNDIRTSDGFTRDGFHGHATIDYTIPNLNLTLTSVTAGNVQKSEDITDLDDENTSGIFNFYTLYGIPNIESFYQWFARVETVSYDVSQEIRLSSDPTDQLRYTIGGNYARSVSMVYIDGLFPFGATDFGGGGPQIADTEAVFGSVSYDILPNFTLSAEGRYQTDGVAVFNRPLTGPDTLVASSRNYKFLPRAIAQYKLSPELMVYASYAKGANPGVFNDDLVGIPAKITQEFSSLYGAGIAVQPETLTDYELGVKGRALGGRLQFATDVYYDLWTHQILSQFLCAPGIPGYLGGEPDCQTVQVNGGDTHLYGVEFDGAYQVTPQFVVTAAAALNATEIVTYPGYVCPSDACTPNGGITNIDGKSLPNAPRVSATITGTYTGKINDKYGWYGRGEYIYKGASYTDLSNLTKIGDSNKFNFRVGITYSTVSIEAFVLNAFNDRQYTSSNGTTDIDGQPNALGVYPSAAIVGLPVLRQFGVRLKYKF